MKNELISIVVPVYNVEKYLEKCVDSILKQTYKNLEIVLVDDGSTDSSGKMCDELAKLDDRIKVYHKENGGLSDARNYGVERATGEYIGFVDSDDYIEKEMYEKLYDAITKENADVAECNFNLVYPDKQHPYAEEEYYIVLDKEGYISEYVKMDRLFGSACMKLLRREVAQRLNFPKGKLYEDAFYSFYLMQEDLKYVIFSTPLYNYIMRSGSITNSKFNSRNLDLIEIANNIHDYAYENYPYLKDFADRRLTYSYFNTLDTIIRTDNYKKNIFFKEMKNYFRNNKINIMKNSTVSRNRKIRMLIMLANTDIYKLILTKFKI